ncbi:MAG: carbamate kinase [Gammaproteobacteria bacterium]
MRIVAALGGNALLRRGQPLTAENQRRNVAAAAAALAPIALNHSLVISHGNGPQVGLLALQGFAYNPEESYPLDVLDAETEGMIGYMIEQEMAGLLPDDKPCATLLTQIEVDPMDPAFHRPEKPIGPVFPEAEARRLAHERGWSIAAESRGFRRVVASPKPLRILEMEVIDRLAGQGVTVICAGGGGIPVVRRKDGGFVGVEAVIDKDLASALLARELKARVLLMLTDVDAVHAEWPKPGAGKIRRISPAALRGYSFERGTMAPKIDAACDFVEATGGTACIGRLEDAEAILAGRAGTSVLADVTETVWWD